GSTALNGGSVTTSTFQTYGDTVTLGANDTLTSTGGGALTFAKTVDGAFALTVNTSGATTFAAAAGGGTPLVCPTPGALGSTALNGGLVRTSAAQSYGDTLTIGATTTLTSTGGGAISLAKTVDGAFALTVNTAGTTTFGGAVGGSTALVSVSTDAAGST